MTVEKVEKWQASDGSLHETEVEARKYEAQGYFGCGRHLFKCPQCKGVGHVKDPDKPIVVRVVDEEATAWGGFFAQEVYRDVVTGYKRKVCDVCGGKGWTTEEKTPIIKTERRIVGWR